MSVTIWHNPRCSKSRRTLEIIQDNNIEPQIRLYLEDAPDAGEIKHVLEMLNITARALMRAGEAEYREQNLASVSDEDALIAAMAQTPKLIERPVVINADKAVIGRPPESVLDIL